MKNKVKALAQHLGVSKKDIEQSSYDENLFEYGSGEYLVVTDEEADDLWEESLDNYLEDAKIIMEDAESSYSENIDYVCW